MVAINEQKIWGEHLEAPWSRGAAPPGTPAPPGATDCHHHIFDPRFTPTEGRALPVATAGDYRLFKRRLGVSRSVVIAPSSYGTDNACLIDALGQLGASDARGVALVDPDVPDAELDRLHRCGVRGMRIYAAKNRVPSPGELQSMGRRAFERGWNLQFVGNRDREVLLGWEQEFLNLPCAIVIDHFGWAPQPSGLDSETAKMLFRLIDRGRAYVKLSGLYQSSRTGFPAYRDLDPLAIRLVRTAPERLLWGTDWPHTGAGPNEKPDGAMLFDRLAEWAPDPSLRKTILVDNPSRLYWAD